jgi:hypothetical protein
MTFTGVLKFPAALALALLAAIVVALVARPQLRTALIAQLYDPADLPRLTHDARVHFEPAAHSCAESAAAALSSAITKIETEHGRPFAKPPVVGVYADFTNYARANGLGDADVAAVSRAGRAILSPVLCTTETARLASVLTHELSHVHFFGWRPRGAPRPPQWFTEGLAVLASDGGAAESVSDDGAAQAIRDGYAIELDESSWANFLSIPFVAAPPCGEGCDLRSYRQRLAYREAALFIGWLRRTNPQAFSGLMRALESGADFDAAFHGAYDATPQQQWTAFAASLQASR